MEWSIKEVENSKQEGEINKEQIQQTKIANNRLILTHLYQ